MVVAPRGATVTVAVGIGRWASAAADDQTQANAAIAAFTDVVTAAGFTPAGPGDDGDVLGLVPVDETDDPSAVARNACLAGLARHVTEDGSFVGETARSTSESFELAGGDPESTDGFDLLPVDEVSAVAAAVEDPTGITAIVDGFSSEKLWNCLSAALALQASAVASTAPPDDQAAADAAIAAFTQSADDAGFESDGVPAHGEADLFDVVPAEGDDPADYVCTEAIRAAVADDGSLVGETARATSDSFLYTTDESAEPDAPTDDGSISVVVVTVADDGLDELEKLIAVFGSDELRSCLQDVAEESIGSAGGLENVAVTVEVDDDLGVGDQSSQFRLAATFDSGGAPDGFTSTLALARTGTRLVLVTAYTGGLPSRLDPATALHVVVDALAA